MVRKRLRTRQLPKTPSSAGRPANPWNKGQLAELKADKLCLAALQEKYKPIFEKNEFPVTRLIAFRAKIKAARDQTAATGQAGTVAEGITLDEEQAQKALIADIRKVQAKACPHQSGRAQGLSAWHGRRGKPRRPGTAFAKYFEQDCLRTPARRGYAVHHPDGGASRGLSGVNVTQGSSEAQARNERIKRDQQIEAIKDERIQLQHVIDGEFPPGEPANVTVRREFDLPANRPFNALKRKAA